MLSSPASAFISYCHVSPDRELAAAIEENLESVGIRTFRDTGIGVGAEWERVIDSALQACTHLIVLLSKASTGSDMVRQEVQTVYERMKRREARILPVWVGDPLRLSYGTGAWLNPLQFVVWKAGDGHEVVCRALLSAIVEDRLLPEQPLEPGNALGASAGAWLSQDLLSSHVERAMRPAMSELFHVVAGEGDGSAISAAQAARRPPYLPRHLPAGDLKNQLLAGLRAGRHLLLTGRTGLGKSREIAEVARELATLGWTTYEFDCGMARLALPRSVEVGEHRRVLLVFDGLQNVGGETDGGKIGTWLEEMLRLFRYKLTDEELRVIVSVRDEPRYRHRLDFGNPSWAELHRLPLPEFDESALGQLLTRLASHRGISIEDSDVAEMVAESDRTPATIVEQVEIAERRGGRLTLALWNEIKALDRDDFAARPAEAARALPLVWSLVLLQGAYLVPALARVVDLARRLGSDAPEAGLGDLLDRHVAGEIDGVVRIFGSSQAARLLEASGQPGPPLSQVWREVRDAVVSSGGTDAGRDCVRLAYACAREGALDAACEIVSTLIDGKTCQADALYARALFRFAAGDRQRGRADLEASLESGRKTAEAATLLGLIELEAGQAESALATLRAAAELPGTNPSTQLAICLAEWRSGNPENAIRHASAVIEAADENASCALLARGCLRLQLGDWDGAAGDLEQATPCGVPEGTIYLMQGLARRRSDPRKAEERLSRAIELGQTPAIAYAERGAARSSLGWHHEAESDFSAAITQLPANHELRFARGVSRLLAGECPLAEEDFATSIALGRDGSEVYSQRAAARLRQENFAGAEADLGEALARATDDEQRAALYAARGQVRWRLERFRESMDDSARASQLSRRGPGGLLAWLRRKPPPSSK